MKAPPNSTLENGVYVARTSERVWCASSGKRKGLCAKTEKDCKKNGPCKRTDNYACFGATERTSGKEQTICLVTYALCDAITEEVTWFPELASLTDCVIYRYEATMK